MAENLSIYNKVHQHMPQSLKSEKRLAFFRVLSLFSQCALRTIEITVQQKLQHTCTKHPFHQIDRGSAALIKQHQELVKTFGNCLLEEYTTTHPNDPQWMKRLLFPHLEELHQVSTKANTNGPSLCA